MDLLKFLVYRLVLGLLALFGLATATFFMMKAIPGDPFADAQTMLPETLKALHHYYGLDEPLDVQYLRYLSSIFTFDFGPSLKYQSQTVNQIIFSSFPVSATIGIEALLIAIPLGLLTGSFLSHFQNIWATSATILGVSVPTFVLATSLQFLFAIYIPLLPVARLDSFSHTILPSLALAIGPTCFIARLLRTSILEVRNMSYIQTARMKGLSEMRIMIVHVWKNALLPVLGYLGPVTTNVLVGSFVVERVFGIPGLGQWFVNGVINRDYPVIGGLTIFYSILLITIHTLLDLITYLIVPTKGVLHEA